MEKKAKQEIIQKYKFSDIESYKSNLNQAPKPNWCKKRSLSGTKESIYVPIHIQQGLADIFFREWHVVDEQYQVIINEILCTVKIQALPDFPDAEHIMFSGTGAKPIQCDSGMSPSKFPIGKKANALEYNAPSRSAAISNALSTIGNIFGKNLSREAKNDFNFAKEVSDNNTDKKPEAKK